MKRFLLFTVVVSLSSCTAPAERVPLQALPENGQVLPYASLLTRVRAQADAANEAFYLDRWGDLEDLAKGIEQTSRFLSKAKDVPAKIKDILNEATNDLAKNAAKLRDAAVAKNEKEAIAAIGQITVKVRQLRLTD